MGSINQQDNHGAPVISLAIWLAAQVAAIGACAARTMLWVRSPRASEQLALAVLLGVQIGVASLIFPHLLRTIRSTLLAIVSAIPLAQLAAALADASSAALIRGELCVVLWLIALHLWLRSMRSSWLQLFAIALGAMVSIGGPLLYYLRLEFAVGTSVDSHLSTASANLSTPIFFGPIAGAISQTIPDPGVSAIVVLLIVCGVAGLNLIRQPIWKNFSRKSV